MINPESWNELNSLRGEYFTTKGTYKEKLDAVAAKYNEFPIVNES
jgi:hypothetical protein